MKFLIVDIRQRVGDVTTPHYAVSRITEELEKLSLSYDLCHYDEIGLFTEANALRISAKEKPLNDYSHIIMRGHRTAYEYMLKRCIVDFAHNNGIKVQNAKFIQLLPHYDKLIQMTILSEAGLPYLDSFYAVDGRYWEKDSALKRIGFPLIYKHTEGAYRTEIIDGKEKLKKNVFLINNVKELEKECKLRDEPEDPFISKQSMFFIQKYADIGEDYRAIMLGGSFLSGWKRVATKGFLTVSKGSEYSLYDKPDQNFLKLVEDTAMLLQADYCAVDVIYTDGKPYILEVNMNPGFKAFETKLEGEKPNVAKAIVENMLT